MNRLMDRIVLSTTEVLVKYPPPGQKSWLQVLSIQTSAGEREIVQRANGEHLCAKVLPVFVKAEALANSSLTLPLKSSRFSLNEFVSLLKAIGLDRCSVYFLAADRPSTYLPTEFPLSKNFLYECPGGALARGEDCLDGGVREAMEELSVNDSEVLAAALLTEGKVIVDSGTHHEWSSLVVVLCCGTPMPPKAEGFVAEACRMVPLPKIGDFIAEQEAANIGVDGNLIALLGQLFTALSGGWAKLCSAECCKSRESDHAIR